MMIFCANKVAIYNNFVTFLPLHRFYKCEGTKFFKNLLFFIHLAIHLFLFTTDKTLTKGSHFR